MKIIDQTLYLEFNELVECGLSENTLWDAKKKGANCWRFIKDPADGRKVLIDYEHLKDVYKKIVIERFGNPYDRVARMPILKMVELDFKANEFYKKYRYNICDELPDGEWLDIKVVNKYTRAASWLGMLKRIQENKKEIKKTLGLSLSEFFIHTSELINLEKKRGKLEGYAGLDVLPGDFPGSYQRLIAKASSFGGAQGDSRYESLIDPLYGNKNAAKIGKMPLLDEVSEGNLPVKVGLNDLKTQNKRGVFAPELEKKQMAVIRAIAEKHNNFDAAQVAEMANLLFGLNGWNTLTVGRIRQIMNENEYLLTPGRRGKRDYMNNIAMQNKRKGPPYPMIYWTLDGWTAEMMFQERNAAGKIEYKRLAIVVVLDAWNKYPVGYAVGERENTELIKLANRNALEHVHELLTPGEQVMYCPRQLQSDNYQIKNLTPFYQAMTHHFTPAAVGNSKGKIIEPYFKYLNKKYAQYAEFWTGFNVDAKKGNQVNKEYLDKVKGNAPDRAGLIKQLDRMMERERSEKGEAFVAQWKQLPATDRMVFSDMDYLRVMGMQLGERTNKITGQGIIKQVGGVERTYDSFDPAFRANMHLDWKLYGVPEHMERVLAESPDGKLKFVLEEKRILPMDIYSTTQADVDYRMRVKGFNDDRVAEIIDLYGNDARIAAEVVENTPLSLSNEHEMDLKLMLTYNGQQKEKLQNAKGLVTMQKKEQKRIMREELVQVEQFQEQRFQFLTEGVNLDEYGK